MLRLTSLLATLLLALNAHSQQYQLKPSVAHRAEISETAPILADIVRAMQVQRQKLEPLLTAADKQQLADLRTVYRSKAYRLHLHSLKWQDSSQTGPLRQAEFLAKKYEVSIARLLAELAPLRQQWEAQLQAVEQKYAADRPAKYHAINNQALLDTIMEPRHLLLLDPNRSDVSYVHPFRFM